MAASAAEAVAATTVKKGRKKARKGRAMPKGSKSKKWTDVDAWTQAPMALKFQLAEDINPADALEAAIEFLPFMPEASERLVTLTPGARNAQPKTLATRMNVMFGHWSAEEWLKAAADLKWENKATSTAMYVLLYVAFELDDQGRPPNNFSKDIFTGKESPSDTSAETVSESEDGDDDRGPKRLELKRRKANKEPADDGASTATTDDDGTDDGNDDSDSLTADKGDSGAKLKAVQRRMQELEKEAADLRGKVNAGSAKKRKHGGSRKPAAGGSSELRAVRRELLSAREEGRRKDVIFWSTEEERLEQEEVDDFVDDRKRSRSPRGTQSPSGDKEGITARELITLLTTRGVLPTAGIIDDETATVPRASPLRGKATSADDVYNSGALAPADLKRLRLREFLDYQRVLDHSSASRVLDRGGKRKVSVGGGVTINVDADQRPDEDNIMGTDMSYIDWDTAARIVEEAMLKERPDEHDGFLEHQRRVRKQAKQFKMTHPSGYLYYDKLTRKMAARIQTGPNAAPFSWESANPDIYATVFAGHKLGKCETCGSPDHFGDGHAAAVKAARAKDGKRRSAKGDPPDDETPEPKTKKQRKAAAQEKEREAVKKKNSKGNGKACFDWNNGDCDHGASCRFTHGICRACGGNHRWTHKQCKDYDQIKIDESVARSTQRKQ